MEPIATHNLTKDYGSGRGVFDVSIAVRAGEVFGFLGPNGAGKSTTIRHLMGFSRPDKGDARLFGLDSFGHYAEVMGRVGYLPGEIALPAGLTRIEESVFSACTALKSVDMGSGVTEIGFMAFFGCTALEEIRFEGTAAQWNAIVKDPDWALGAGEIEIAYA